MSFFDNLSIKNKLTGIIILITLLTLAGGFTFVILNDIRTFKNDMVNDTKLLAKVTADYSVTDLAFNDKSASEQTLQKLESIEYITYACIYDTSNAVFSELKKSDIFVAAPEVRETSSEFDNNYLHIFNTISYENQVYGTIYIRFSTIPLNNKISKYLITMISLMALLIALSTISALRLQAIISKPILKLSQTARDISLHGNYSVRVKKTGNDETGQLYDGFNTMLEQIQKRERERNKAEEALRLSEERFRRFAENAKDVIYRMSLPEGRYEYISPAATEIFGYTPNEMYNSPMLIEKMVHPDWLGYFSEQWDNLLKGDMPPYYEYMILHKSGKIKWLNQRNVLILDEEGKPAAIEGIVTDITERKLAEEALAASKQKLSLHIQQTPLGVIEWDLNFNVTEWNRSAETIFGFTRDEAIGHHAGDLIIPENMKEHVNNIWNNLVNQRGSLRSLNKNLTKNGNIIFCEWYNTALVDSGGSVIGAASLVQDITDRKRTDEEMNRLRNLLKNIVDSMPSVLVGVDTEGRITQWNKEAVKETGLTEDKVNGRILSDVLPQMTGEMEKVKQAIRNRVLQKDEKVISEKDGEMKYSDITVYPLISNGVEGAVIRIDDITNRVRMEEMMIQTEKMMSVGGLAAGMAHEINNPLAGIMQSSQVILERTSPESPKNVRIARECGTDLPVILAYLEKRKIIQFIKGIIESGNRASKIVSNMLSFSRKSQSSHNPEKMSDLLDNTIELAANDYDLKKMYDFRHIKIIRDYDPELPDVSCDKTKMQQVFLNLIKNSAQALCSGKNSVKYPRITLRTFSTVNSAIIEIEDNGPGISDTTSKRMFEPFYTTKPVGIGTGLGLSVSYFIVTENHRGSLSAESIPGNGTKFVIKLPIERNK